MFLASFSWWYLCSHLMVTTDNIQYLSKQSFHLLFTVIYCSPSTPPSYPTSCCWKHPKLLPCLSALVLALSSAYIRTFFLQGFQHDWFLIFRHQLKRHLFKEMSQTTSCPHTVLITWPYFPSKQVLQLTFIFLVCFLLLSRLSLSTRMLAPWAQEFYL